VGGAYRKNNFCENPEKRSTGVRGIKRGITEKRTGPATAVSTIRARKTLRAGKKEVICDV